MRAAAATVVRAADCAGAADSPSELKSDDIQKMLGRSESELERMFKELPSSLMHTPLSVAGEARPQFCCATVSNPGKTRKSGNIHDDKSIEAMPIYIDSCCENHITSDKSLLYNFRKGNFGSFAGAFNEKETKVPIEGIGTIACFSEDTHGYMQLVCLDDVFYVPALEQKLGTLICPGQLNEQNIDFLLTKDNPLLTDGESSFPLQKCGRLYKWKIYPATHIFDNENQFLLQYPEPSVN